MKKKTLNFVLYFTLCVLTTGLLSFQKDKGNPAIHFQHHYIDTVLPLNPGGVGDYGATALVDIDRDGKLDFVIGGRQIKTLYWYQYKSAGNWERHTVGTDYLSDVGLAAMDVDGDGWIDLVGSGVWFRNTGNPREQQFERILFDNEGSGAHDIVCADVNGDGKKDIVMMGDSSTQLKGIYWYKIPSNPRGLWEKHFVGESIHGAIAPTGVGDINGDGHADIVRADTWFENKTGDGKEWIIHKNIPMGRKGPFGYCVRTAIADIDGNGKTAIVMCDADIENSKMVILRSPDGKGLQWEKQELPQSFPYGSLHALAVADFNGDGLLDIVSNEQEELLPEGRENPRWVVWINQGSGKFIENIILDAKLGGHELQVGDVDGDGDIDICSKAWGTRPWNAVNGAMHVDYLENQLALVAQVKPITSEEVKGGDLAGRWDMQVKEGNRVAPSWLEVEISGLKTLVGRFVGDGGSARPISEIKFDNGNFSFSIPPQWEQSEKNMTLQGKLNNGRIEGTIQSPSGTEYTFTGTKAPLLTGKKTVKWGEPVRLFNGKDLDGWQATGSVNQWYVKDGVLISPHSGSNLISTRKFGDFKLHVEFKYTKESNSGVYLRGRYEVQIIDNPPTDHPSSHLFGGVYGFLTPSEMAVKGADEWQSYDITLIGRMVTIAANGVEIICNQEIPGITGGALDSNESEPGPIYFQGDHGPVMFRNIIITPAE